MGEYTEVASANRGVRSAFIEESEEEDDVRGFMGSTGRVFSLGKDMNESEDRKLLQALLYTNDTKTSKRGDDERFNGYSKKKI